MTMLRAKLAQRTRNANDRHAGKQLSKLLQYYGEVCVRPPRGGPWVTRDPARHVESSAALNTNGFTSS